MSLQLTSLEKFQNVVDRDRSLCRILEVDLDDDLELAPAGLGDLVGRLGDSSVGIGVTVVKLEVDFLHICGHVLVVVGFEVDRPLVSVTVLFSFLAEIFTDISFISIQ